MTAVTVVKVFTVAMVATIVIEDALTTVMKIY